MIDLKKIKKKPIPAAGPEANAYPAMPVIPFESDITPLQALMKAEELERILKAWKELCTGARRQMTPERYEQIRALSNLIKNLFNVDPDKLDPIPLDLNKITSFQVREYVNIQFRRWENAAGDILLKDAATSLIMKQESIGIFVSALAEVTHRPPLVVYIRNVIGKIANMDDAAAARNILSLGMSNMLLYNTLDRVATDDSQTSLAELMESHTAGEWNLKTHAMMIFLPFQRRLETLIFNYYKLDLDT